MDYFKLFPRKRQKWHEGPGACDESYLSNSKASPLTEWDRQLVTLQVLPCSMDLMSPPSVTAKGQRVLTKLHEGLTTAKKKQQSGVNDKAETYQANCSRLPCLVSPIDVHWLELSPSLIVYAAKGPCAERLTSLSVCLLECLSLVFFRYEPHIFSCWLSELVAPPFEFKQAAVAPWTRYEEGLWRERPTPINTCVWRKLAVEKLVKSARRC